MIDYAHPDLTQHPPRSPRVRLGGFAQLPRLLDKARATLAGKQGDYIYGGMMDRQFLAFTGIEAAAFRTAVQAGRADGDMLAWVLENLKPARNAKTSAPTANTSISTTTFPSAAEAESLCVSVPHFDSFPAP